MIDFRIRPPYGDFFKLGLFDTLMPRADLSQENMFTIEKRRIVSAHSHSISDFIHEMDSASIDLAVIMGRRTGTAEYGDVDNAQIHGLCRDYPDRFIGFGGVNPFEDNCLEQVEHMARSWGFKGIAVDPGWYETPIYADAPCLLPVYELCQNLGLIVSITSSAHMGPDISYCDPLFIQRVARSFPKLCIVITHASWPQFAGAIGVALACPNVWLSPDVYFYMPYMAFADEMAKAANGFLRKKILFASSYPGYGLPQAVEYWNKMPLTNEARLDTGQYNALALLNDAA